MQAARRPFAALTTPGGATVSLAMKAAIRRTLDDRPNVANVLNNLGNVRRDLDEFAAAQAHYGERLALNHALGADSD